LLNETDADGEGDDEGATEQGWPEEGKSVMRDQPSSSSTLWGEHSNVDLLPCVLARDMGNLVGMSDWLTDYPHSLPHCFYRNYSHRIVLSYIWTHEHLNYLISITKLCHTMLRYVVMMSWMTFFLYCYASLVGDPMFADVKFVTEGGRSVYAHRFILETRSDYFRTMFRTRIGSHSGGAGRGVDRPVHYQGIVNIAVPGSDWHYTVYFVVVFIIILILVIINFYLPIYFMLIFARRHFYWTIANVDLSVHWHLAFGGGGNSAGRSYDRRQVPAWLFVWLSATYQILFVSQSVCLLFLCLLINFAA
jgi:hypothetical protein